MPFCHFRPLQEVIQEKAEALTDVVDAYDLQNKVRCIVADSASNMHKAIDVMLCCCRCIFYPRGASDVWGLAIIACLSVCLSMCHTPVLYQNG